MGDETPLQASGHSSCAGRQIPAAAQNEQFVWLEFASQLNESRLVHSRSKLLLVHAVPSQDKVHEALKSRQIEGLISLHSVGQASSASSSIQKPLKASVALSTALHHLHRGAPLQPLSV
jgi:hypothetical protein